ncbi:tetratricopeptide repeat protein, partial [Patescibacteria group bacterium]|nr:tetratricopeptide repeat protein [Patescibacteria group bacterium]
KAIENAPAQLFTYNNLYELYRYSVGDMDKAEKILLRGIDDNPMDPYLMIILGIFYEEKGKISDALFYYKKALEFDPENEALKKDIDRLK